MISVNIHHPTEIEVSRGGAANLQPYIVLRLDDATVYLDRIDLNKFTAAITHANTLIP